MRIRDKKNIALVLSGGGIKAAAFHIGVCLALKEKGFRFIGGTKDEVQKKLQLEGTGGRQCIKLYVGSSAGSFISAVLSSGYTIESLVNAFEVGSGSKKSFDDYGLNQLKPLSYRHIFHLNKKGLLRGFPKILGHKGLVQGGIEALIKNSFQLNGLFTTDGFEQYLRRNVLPLNDFAKLGARLFVISTQLNHSRKVVFGNYENAQKDEKILYVNYASISQAVAASAALPPVYAPYCIKRPDQKDMYFFDGEIRDTLSTHVAADHGSDLVIASYSVQPYHYTPELGSLHTYGIPVILNQALYQVIQQKIEKHIEHQQEIRGIYQAVEGYLRQAQIAPEHRQKILEIIEKKVGFKREVDYIYIHPKPQNYEMFFVDHFSLNPKILERIVRIGFKSALSIMRQYDF